MLATPGRSPRQLSPLPSPGPGPAPSNDAMLGGTLVLSSGRKRSRMGPPPPKRAKRQVVLDEDVYVAAIEKIVERDFYPDIPKLQNRLEWLEAIRSGDPVIIREAQLKIIRRRADKAREGTTPSAAATPGTGFVTPGSILAASPALSVRSDGGLLKREVVAEASQSGLPDTSMSLDNFLRKYTSEDNASFVEIKERDDEKRRAKVERQLTLGQTADQLLLSQEGGNGTEAVERITDGYGTSGQPTGTLRTWDYHGRNLLMYDSSNRADAPLTVEEIEEQAKGPPKEVRQQNTRFHGPMFKGQQQSQDDTVAILYTPVPGATPVPMDREGERGRRYDLEDMLRTPRQGGGGAAANGVYGLVHTPSPAPGVDESPFMTWGEIEGTPLRLEVEDTPVGIGGSSEGPHFKIPAAPSRDEAALNMSRSAGRSLRERSRIAAGGVSPSPIRIAGGPGSARGWASPGSGTLSLAAQKLVHNAIKKKSLGNDATLRATYGGGTPGKSPLAWRSRETSLPAASPLGTPVQAARASEGISIPPAPG